MILSGDFTIRARLEERTRTRGGSTHLRHFAESVLIAVIGTPRAVTREHVRTYLAVLAHHRRVEIGMDIIAGMLVDHARVGYIDKVTHGLFGNDVHHAGNRIRTVHRRTTAADDFYTVNHRSRHLLQSIDRRHTRENRPAVHQNLGILSLQTVDTQFCLTTVRAGVLYPQARLKIQHVSHARDGCCLK